HNAQKSGGVAQGGTPDAAVFIIPGTTLSVQLWQLSVVLLLVLALLLFASWMVRSRKPYHPAFKADLDEANRRAAVVAPQFERQEAAKRVKQEHNQVAEQPTIPVHSQQALEDKTLVLQSPRELHCPQCGELVIPNAHFCPHCRQVLVLSESG